MSQEITSKTVFVGGIYNWPAKTTKELRRANREYSRHNWCDIDTTNIINYDAVLTVFKGYKIDCVTQRCGKGWHVFGDLVDFPTWKKVWDEIKPYADPLWAPHTMRITKKRSEEVWDRPIYHKHKNDPPKWSKSLMHFLCKVLRNENSSNIWTAMHDTGLDKYFQCTCYEVELK